MNMHETDRVPCKAVKFQMLTVFGTVFLECLLMVWLVMQTAPCPGIACGVSWLQILV